MSTSPDITQLLKEWGQGSQSALEKLIPLVYEELRRIAVIRLTRESADQTLQATELVHEAYMRLINWSNSSWQNRAHFYGVAAQLMRNILVDQARTRLAAKRGGERQKLRLDEIPELAVETEVDLIVLDDLLNRLATIDPQQARIIELRYFGGLTIEEVAEVMRISITTIKREWNIARAWLLREMSHRD